MKKAHKILASGILALPITAVLFYLSARAHLSIYQYFSASTITRYGQDYSFDQQFFIHLWAGVPLFYIGSVFVLWKMFSKP